MLRLNLISIAILDGMINIVKLGLYHWLCYNIIRYKYKMHLQAKLHLNGGNKKIIVVQSNSLIVNEVKQ